MTIDTTERFNPFPGLRPFSIEEDYLFFGREEQTAELLGLLREHRLIAVVGTSGSGKSSLVRAGLLPALLGGTMTQAGSSWEVMLLRPGGNPLKNLARAILEAELYDPDDEESLPRISATLNRSRTGLIEAVKQSDLASDTNLLIVVDQFEELFRFRQSGIAGEEGASAFVKLLLAASQQMDQPIYVALTMRSDYLGDCAEVPGLAEAVNDGEYLIPRLTREQRRAAIERPVSVGRGQIATRLIHKLLNDAGDDADQLPVLQHALMRIWDLWSSDHDDDEPLDLRHYEQVGGLDEALSLHADEVFAELVDDRQRLTAEKTFKALTERGPDNRGIRRPTQLKHLCSVVDGSEEEVTAVIDAFRRPGVTFLMPMQEVELNPETVIDISHESLMRVWKRLDRWVEEESQSARIYKRLAETATLHQEGKAGTYRDPDLQIALSWRDATHPNEAWARRYHAGFQAAMQFLNESSAAKRGEEETREAARQHELEQARKLAEAERLRAEEQLRSAGRLKGLAIAAGLAAAIAFVAFVGAMLARQRAQEAERNAVSQAELAEQERGRAVAARQEADVQRELTRRSLYLAQINKAQRIAETAGGTERLNGLLAALRPASAEDDDLRGWEWYYLHSRRTRGAQVINTSTGGVYCVAFSHDGTKLAYGGRDNLAHMRDLASGKQTHILSGHGEPVMRVVWSPAGQLIATSSLDGTVRLWDANRGIPMHTLRSHSGACQPRFSPDGSRLATADSSGTVRIWNPDSGRLLQVLTNDATREFCLWSPDGQQLVTPGETTLDIWDIDGGELVMQVTDLNDQPVSAAWDPGGRRIVSTDQSGNAFIWDLENGGELSRTLTGHSTVISDVEWSPDGKSIVTASFDNTARVWDADRGELLHVLGDHSGRVHDAAWHADSQHVATASVDGTVIVWDLTEQAGETAAVFASHGSSVDSIAWSPDSRWIAGVNSDGALMIWDADRQQPPRHFGGSTGGINCLAWSPDGQRLAAGCKDRAVRFWDATTGDQVGELREHAAEVMALAWAPDGEWLAAGAATRLHLWEVGDLEQSKGKILRGHGGVVRAIAWSPDGERLASGGSEPFGRFGAVRIRIWDPRSGKSVAGLHGEFETINALAWSPDGQRLASAGHYSDSLDQNVTVRLWDVDEQQPTWVARAHFAQVSSLDWMTDGSRLASASRDGSVIVWNPRNGREFLTFDSHGGAVNCLDWSPDGTRIAAGDSSGAIRVFDAKPGYQGEYSEVLLPSLGSRIANADPTSDDYQLRAQIRTRNGRWAEAAADFHEAAQMADAADSAWFTTQWWLAGPFPGELEQPYPPESNPDPFRPIEAVSGGGSPNAPSRWRPVLLDARNGINLDDRFDQSDHISCYLYSRVYSPRDQEVTVLLGTDDYHRLWINGQLIHEGRRARPARPDQDAASATLRIGWNDVLLKVVNLQGNYGAYVRFSDKPSELAQSYVRAGQWADAIAEWKRAIEAEPDSLPSRMQLVATYRQAGQPEEAITELSALIDSYPQSSALLFDCAELYQEQGRWSDAIAIYDRLIELQPDDWSIRGERGGVFARRSQEFVVRAGSNWKWLHPADGVDPATTAPDFHQTFFQPDFDDSQWNGDADRGGFGYGDPVGVDIGTPSADTVTTAYFRHRFATDVDISNLTISMQYDDGVVVYLDGAEVGRDGVVGDEAFQLRAGGTGAEQAVKDIALAGKLEPGEHVLAISLHNRSGTSSDLRLAQVSLGGWRVSYEPEPLDHPAELIGRALAFQEAGRDTEAEVDFERAFAKLDPNTENIARLAEVFSRVVDTYIRKGNLDFAIAILNHAIRSSPSDAPLRETRGNVHARLRHWNEAAEDLSAAVELDPDNHWNWYRLSSLLVEMGDLERYRQHCRELVVRFAEAGALEGGRVIQGCVLLPDAVEDWDEIVARSAASMAEVSMPTRLTSHGVFEFRRGNYQEAISWIQKGLDKSRDASMARALFPLAMACYHLGEASQAEDALSRGEQLLQSGFAGGADLGLQWHDWLCARLLRREAAELIRGSATPLAVDANPLPISEAREVDRLSQQIQSNPDDPDLLVRRADRYASNRRWQLALRDYQRAVELGVENSIPWMRCAVLLAKFGDRDAYHQHCQNFLAHYEDIGAIADYERIARSSLVISPLPTQQEAFFRAAESSVTLDPSNFAMAWAQVAKGLAEYCAGNYSGAINWCRKTLDESQVADLNAQGYFVQAMAYHRLNQLGDADVALANGSRLLAALTERFETRGTGFAWHDWMFGQLLHDEARALIEP